MSTQLASIHNNYNQQYNIIGQYLQLHAAHLLPYDYKKDYHQTDFNIHNYVRNKDFIDERSWLCADFYTRSHLFSYGTV